MKVNTHRWRRSGGPELAPDTPAGDLALIGCVFWAPGNATDGSILPLSKDTSLLFPPRLNPVNAVMERGPWGQVLVRAKAVPLNGDSWLKFPQLLAVDTVTETAGVPTSAVWLQVSLTPLSRVKTGRPSREMLFRNNRAACLRRESLLFRWCSLCGFAVVPPWAPPAAAAILQSAGCGACAHPYTSLFFFLHRKTLKLRLLTSNWSISLHAC